MERTSDISTHVTPHIFRHTFTSTSIDRGMSVVAVSKLLGHARLDTTMDYVTVNAKSIKTSHQNCVI